MGNEHTGKNTILKLKKLKRKLDKQCNKKITIGYAIGMILLILIIILGLEVGYLHIRNNNNYFYENIYGQRGHSKHCKKIEREYYCEEFVKIKWYVEE